MGFASLAQFELDEVRLTDISRDCPASPPPPAGGAGVSSWNRERSLDLKEYQDWYLLEIDTQDEHTNVCIDFIVRNYAHKRVIMHVRIGAARLRSDPMYLIKFANVEDAILFKLQVLNSD